MHGSLESSWETQASVVPEEGVEPTRPCDQRILSPPRLPFRHSGTVTLNLSYWRAPRNAALKSFRWHKPTRPADLCYLGATRKIAPQAGCPAALRRQGTGYRSQRRL